MACRFFHRWKREREELPPYVIGEKTFYVKKTCLKCGEEESVGLVTEYNEKEKRELEDRLGRLGISK